jgi:Predicted membrane protein
MTLKKLFFSLEGRLGRKLFWLVSIFVGLLTSFIETVVRVNGESLGAVLMFLFFIITVVSFWTSLAVSVKRAHDRNHSGWFILLGLIPIVGQIWMLIELGCLPGTPGANMYGEPPSTKAPAPVPTPAK